VLIHSRVSSLLPIVMLTADGASIAAKVTVYGFCPPSIWIGTAAHVSTSEGRPTVIVRAEVLTGGRHAVEPFDRTVNIC
jgi:hypothetical protein